MKMDQMKKLFINLYNSDVHVFKIQHLPGVSHSVRVLFPLTLEFIRRTKSRITMERSSSISCKAKKRDTGQQNHFLKQSPVILSAPPAEEYALLFSITGGVYSLQTRRCVLTAGALELSILDASGPELAKRAQDGPH